MPWFGLSVALNAFLLFAVQPLLGKALLPWFGGVAAVWTTCLLFFQVALLLGYGWAHRLQRLAPRRQVLTHGGLLGLALLALALGAKGWGTPLLPDASWRPLPGGHPVGQVLRILLTSVGLPTVAIAATGPLLQSWFAQVRPGESPWRLYALSNGGSLVALGAYPALIEPWLPLHRQAWVWVGLFGLAAVSVLASGIGVLSRRDPPPVTRVAPVSSKERAPWVLLAALPSLLLLAVTNHLCQDVAPIPLLWVLPLALYLLSMILCFESERWYRPSGYVPATALLLLVAEALRMAWAPEVAQVLAFAGLLFTACMICHGELARRRPPSESLTRFYLAVAAGGALGGVGAAVLAPLLFSSFFELDASLLLVAALTFMLLRSGAGVPGGSTSVGPRLANAFLFLVSGLAVASALFSRGIRVASSRSFFGVVRVVRDTNGPNRAARTALLDGASLHGFQIAGDAYRRTPTAYFTPHGVNGLQDPHESGSRSCCGRRRSPSVKQSAG